MYALIYNSAVIDITGIAPTDRYHPDIEIISVPLALEQYIAVGWIFVDGTIQPPDVINFLADKRKSALEAIADKHQAMLIAATGGATAAERDTWVVKESAALDVISGGDGYGAVVPVEGETALQLATKISAKAVAYRQLVGIADNIKRTAEKSVEALPLATVDDLAALDAVLADARAWADAVLAGIMRAG